MNIVPVETVSQDSLPVSAKTDTGGTDLFSILMASIAAGNGIRQGEFGVTTASEADIAGNAVFSAQNVEFAGQDNGSAPGMPLTPSSAATTKEVTLQDTGSDPGVADPFAGLGKPASEGSQVTSVFKNSINVGNEDSEGAILPLVDGKEQVNLMPTVDTGKFEDVSAKGELVKPGQPDISLPLTASGVVKDPSYVAPYRNLTPGKIVNCEKAVNRNLPEIKAGTQGKAPAVELTAQAETADPSSVQPLLPQAVKGVKAGDGVEVKDENLKAGLVVSGNDEGETVKGLDIVDGIVTAFGSESIEVRLLHASAKPLAAVEGQRPQIDPADLMAQVSGRIKADFKSEGGEVRMELHPESLGHLKIEIRVEGGVVRANILTENAMVRDTIDSNISILRSSLEEHGLRIDQLSVGVDQHHSGNAFAERKDTQMWQGFENVDASLYEGEEPVNESWYHADSWQDQGVSIFA